MVQTGAKTQLGGEKNGFCKVTYQVGIAAIVKGVLINPTPSQIRIDATNLDSLFM